MSRLSARSHRPGLTPSPEPSTANEWLEAVRGEERRGEFLAEIDLANGGLERYPDDLRLKHRSVLALARAGSTNEAARRFAELGLGAVDDDEIAALGARIEKDFALSADGETRRRHAEQAAEAYAAIYARTGGYYPAVNAATLMLLAGDVERSRLLAREVLAVLEREEDRSYYADATAAEASLLLGDEARALESLRLAVTKHGGDHGALFSTRRHLRTVCRLTGAAEGLLDLLAGPEVVFYCGHLLDRGQGGAGLSARQVPSVARAIAAELERRPAGVAYGSLANGADILWAEALLERACELHVVLPLAIDEFVRASVAPAGEEWVRRFERCLAGSTEVHLATDDVGPADDVLYRYGAELAMGLAQLRARYLDASARLLAVWDGRPSRRDAGTAAEIATWRRAGGAVTVVPPIPSGTRQAVPQGLGAPAAETEVRAPVGSEGRRVLRALLFADTRGFSKLNDDELPRFADHVLGAIGQVLDRHEANVLWRNTWGDALYAVLTGVEDAAACALELQEAIEEIDLAAIGLPPSLVLRLAAHFGPVLQLWDPVLKTMTFMGSHVSRAARVEPVTPPSAVYVTEHFAAALQLAHDNEAVCDYVGHMPAAKDFGRLRMYRLRRSTLR